MNTSHQQPYYYYLHIVKRLNCQDEFKEEDWNQGEASLEKPADGTRKNKENGRQGWGGGGIGEISVLAALDLNNKILEMGGERWKGEQTAE